MRSGASGHYRYWQIDLRYNRRQRTRHDTACPSRQIMRSIGTSSLFSLKNVLPVAKAGLRLLRFYQLRKPHLCSIMPKARKHRTTTKLVCKPVRVNSLPRHYFNDLCRFLDAVAAGAICMRFSRRSSAKLKNTGQDY